MQMRWLISLLFCSCAYGASTSDPTAYIYEGGQSLIDLSGMSGTTNMNAGDDQVSNWSPDFGFDFDLWGNTYRKAKMSTNGCVNFSGLNCSDYTPQPLPYKDETLYPFWTDLIRNNNSKMLFKSFDDYVVFGWYGMKEYSYPNHRGNNNFEAILWANDTYEYRYGALDITKHDVLIGEQHTSSVHKTFRYFDDGTGGHNNWDSFDASFSGGVLEGGGSLYSASLAELCSANQLYSTSCSGYAAAYLAQQCGLSALYDSSCSGYSAAYLAQQWGISSLYDSSCNGYAAAYLAQQCGLDATYDSSCDGYWEATFVATVTEDYSDVVEGDDVEDYYFVDDEALTDYYEVDLVDYDVGYDYGEVDTTYDDGSTIDNLGWEEPEEIYVVTVEVVEEVFVEVFETDPLPVIEEVFEEEIFVEVAEVFEEVVVIEEIVEEEEIFVEVVEEELAEISEEIVEEELEDVFEEELIAVEEIFEEEEIEEVIEIEIAEEVIVEVEEEIMEPELEIAEVNIIQLALNIVAETSEMIELSLVAEEVIIKEPEYVAPVIEAEQVSLVYSPENSVMPTALVQSAVSQTTVSQPLQTSQTIQVSQDVQASQTISLQESPTTYTQGTFSFTPTPEAVFADTSFASSSINETQTTALAEVGLVFDSGFSGSMQVAQLGQTDIQQSMDTGGSTDVFGDSGVFDDSGVFEPEIEVVQGVSTGSAQSFNQAVTNTEDTEEVEIMQELSTSVTEMKFEEDFNDAIATGQSIGQFLSNQLPDFGQFNVAPPSVDEERTVERAENALETMTEAEIEQSIESQLENVQDSGGFDDQTLTILLMSRVPGFDVYGVELQDQSQWYQQREIYGGNRPVDGNIRAFQGQGAQTFQEMVEGQYDR